MIWTLLEAGTRTLSKLLQKLVGVASTTIGHLFLVTLIIGCVQTIVGFCAVKVQKKKFFGTINNIEKSGLGPFASILYVLNKNGVAGSIAFGFFAVVNSILSFAAFLYGAEVGINTFIITLSIIPGAIFDSWFFHNKLTGRIYTGMVLAITAGYSILGWPSLSEAAELPFWIWLSLANALGVLP